jgi:hypothetical protein
VFGAFSVDPISKKLQNGQTGQLQWQMAYLLINLSNNSEIQPDLELFYGSQSTFDLRGLPWEVIFSRGNLKNHE